MRIGILGGGQLGQMLALAGVPLGLRFRVLEPTGPEAPAGAVAEVVHGDFDDPDALAAFVEGLDAVTWEFENVPIETVRAIAARVPVFPPPLALESAQDRWVEKTTFEALGVPVAPWRKIEGRATLERAVAELGYPSVLKTCRMGYDGKGQSVLRGADDVDSAFEALGAGHVPLVLEAFVAFRREVSLVGVRAPSGAIRFWPLTENVHQAGILRTSRVSRAGAQADRACGTQAEAEAAVTRVLESLNYVGVLAVEFFETSDGHLLANEMAPRVHNSGHWTQDGACTSQFENHLRAGLGLPLGSTELRHDAVAMLNLIGSVPPVAELLAEGDEAGAGVHRALHLYGKGPRPGRKLGHLNLWGADAQAVDAALSQVRS